MKRLGQLVAIRFWAALCGPAALAVCLVHCAPAAEADAFRDTVTPVLERHCVSCHSGARPKGGLSLETAAQALAGGESGPAIVAGKPADSLLLDYITGDPPEMPKAAPPLAKAEVEAIRQWIAAGAAWPEDQTLVDRKPIDDRWWSLAPLARPQVPAVLAALPRTALTPAADQPPTTGAWIRNPIDAFILARLIERGLEPAPAADRRTLMRRVSFDLVGLPPAPEEVDAFVADADPQAYEKLVDRLLDSPRYGERWARHWLDVVHYGETHGYDKDQPRPNAWPYRDYVIRALNSDKPYRQFVEEQLAGDVLYPGTTDGIEALGFIAAGPWDLIGHVEVPESKIDGQIARHLDRDDMVGTAINTFQSMTVQCAQCHDHKFDPISQEDYYSLQAVFAALDRADKSYDADPAVMRRRDELATRQRTLKQSELALAEKVRTLAGKELAELEKQIAERRQAPAAVQGVEFGYHSAIVDSPDDAKWVQVDLGKSLPIERLVFTPCYDDYNKIGAGFGFPRRFKIEVCDEPDFRDNVRLVLDRTHEDVPNPGTRPQQAQTPGAVGRYVRFTATRLAARQNDFNFALAELAVVDAAGKNVAEGRPVTALDSIEARPRWSTSNLVDGFAPAIIDSGAAAGVPVGVNELVAQRDALLERTVDDATRRQQEQVAAELAEIGSELGKLPAAELVYAGTVYYGTSAFVGTGPAGGKPRKISVLARGDVRQPGREAEPGALSQLGALPGRFQLSADQGEEDRRAALAHWITDARNPLTWRSIVNRVWLYHFGRGLVETPNDFGRMGQLPSHPELLDWLAVEFRDGSQSLKELHRLMVTSATYRQSSVESPQAAATDAENSCYSHMNRRRLEAEEIRDSVLAVSGKLNLAMYGPSFKDFVVEKPEHSPHYLYQLHDPEDPASQRRSIYRFIVRSQQQPFLAAFDCADPSLMVDKRNQTITPLSALALLNNQLTVAMARHFAARVTQPGTDLRQQVASAFRQATCRPASDRELQELTEYARQFGLPNTCRLILNLNEFVFID